MLSVIVFLAGCGLMPAYAPAVDEDYLTYDSNMVYDECLVYQDDLTYLEEVEVELTLTPIPTPEIGDIIEFGGHNWLVLDVEHNKALIITERIIDMREYHVTGASITWASSSIRRWLNYEFYNTFTIGEQAQIAATLVVNSGNPRFNTQGGLDTKDKIFLLSIEEVERYFDDASTRIAYSIYGEESAWWAQPGAMGRTSWGQPWSPGDSATWWLRTPGDENRFAAQVLDRGSIDAAGYFVNVRHAGVRPALWLSLLYK